MADEIRGALHTATQKGVVPVTWDAGERQFVVALRGVVLQESSNPKSGVDIFFKPQVLYDVRIRKAGSQDWGPGYLAPYSAATFIGLEPDTEYEVQVSPVDSSGTPVPDLSIMTNRFHTLSSAC